MAISDDTAALVAAQLTAAWAAHTGPQKPDPTKLPERSVLDVYQRFLEHVSPPSGPTYDINALV